MKNSECEIHIISPKGWIQKYKKHSDKWIQTTNNKNRHMTSEQLLSHILPLLRIDYIGKWKIVVIPDNINIENEI